MKELISDSCGLRHFAVITTNAVEWVDMWCSSEVHVLASNFRYELTKDDLHTLSKELKRLFALGYRWSHAYTQCRLQGILFAIKNEYVSTSRRSSSTILTWYVLVFLSRLTNARAYRTKTWKARWECWRMKMTWIRGKLPSWSLHQAPLIQTHSMPMKFIIRQLTIN